MAIEKAKPLGQNQIDPELAKTRIENMKQQIEYNKEEIELHKESLAIQLKDAKILNPNFGFEETEEWQECLKKQWILNNRKTIDNMEFAIEETIKQIANIQSMMPSKEEKDE